MSIHSPPPRFHHPDCTHPYSRLIHPFTPIRWILYIITAVIAWGGILPVVIVCYLLGTIGGWIVHLIDRCIPPIITLHGGPEIVPLTISQSPTVPSTQVRFLSVDPADRIWLDRGNLDAPGTSPNCLVHAILVFTRPVSIDSIRQAMTKRLLEKRAFDRFLHVATRRTIKRSWLPGFLSEEERFEWMILPPSHGSFVPQAHFRTVPFQTWAEHSLRSEEQRGGRNGRDGNTRERRERRRHGESPMLPAAAAAATNRDGALEPELESQFSLDQLPDHPSALRLARLQAYLSALSSVPLASGQPLWELLCLEPDPDVPPSSQSEGIVVFRCSHAIADGVLLSGIILKTFLREVLEEAAGVDANAVRIHIPMTDGIQPSPSPDGFLPSSSPPAPAVAAASSSPARPRRSCSSSFLRILSHAYLWLQFLLIGPYIILHKSFQPDGENILHASTTPMKHSLAAQVKEKKQICWSSYGFPLHLVKQVSKSLHCTLNDLVMAIWLDVLDEYLIEAEGIMREQLSKQPLKEGSRQRTLKSSLQAPSSMFILVPFNVRSAKETDFSAGAKATLGNKFAVLMVDVPMGMGKVKEGDDETKSHRIDQRDYASDGTREQKDSYHAIPRSSTASSATPFLSRLHSLSSFMTLLKSSPEPLVMYFGIRFLLSYLPRSIANYLLDIYSGLCSAVLTNNRSPEKQLELVEDEESDRIDRAPSDIRLSMDEHNPFDQFPSNSILPPSISSFSPPPKPPPAHLRYWVSWAPQRSSVGICVTILTYHGELRVSIVADERCLRYTTCEKLVQRYQEKLTQLVREWQTSQRSSSLVR